MINYYALSLIIAFMLVSRGLELSGIFNHIVVELLTRVRRPLLLLVLLTIVSGLSASLIMNDAALFIYVSLAIAFIRSMNVDKNITLTLLVLSINMGSALTPIGNPQNIIIWQTYGISFHELVCYMAPLVIISLSIIIISVYMLLKKNTSVAGITRKLPKIYLNRRLFCASIVLFVVDIVLAQVGYSVIGLIITVLTYLVVEKNILLGIDYGLIGVFTLMFIDFTELSRILQGLLVIHLSKSYMIILIAAPLSQLISNVPATIMLVNHVDKLVALAVGVNIGGTGSIIGSLANIIALRLGRLETRKFLKISIPYFIILLTIFYILAYAKIYP